MRLQVSPRQFRVGDRLVMNQTASDLTEPIVLVYDSGFAWDVDMPFEFDEVDPGPYLIERDLDGVLRDLVRVLG